MEIGEWISMLSIVGYIVVWGGSRVFVCLVWVCLPARDPRL